MHTGLIERARGLVAAGKFERSLLVFSGPSGAGKSTLLKRLFTDFPHTFGFSVSHTTRKPRVGEECGVDYHFVEESRFKELIAADSFLEHANFSGNWYGTSFEAIERVQRSGHICILDIDLAGVKSIKKHLAADGHGGLDARYVFVRPPEKGHLEGRLRARGTETDDSLARRLARVDADFEYAAVPGNYNLILVNDDLEAAYLRLVSFIFRLQ